MKGDKNFRELTRSSTMCSNEVYIYKEVLPHFEKFIKSCGGCSLKTNWCPRVYLAEYEIFPELGNEPETILALENLKPLGYRLGPRIDLDEQHLRMMIKHIATYHAVSYAMRIEKDPMLEKLAEGLKPLPFVNSAGVGLESYNVLFVMALQRFFGIVLKDSSYDPNFIEMVKKFKQLYAERPLVLMQKFLEHDEYYSIILHGDYNRNNVLFKYDSAEGFDDPKSIKMIDFQEVRYATPVIDLAFFMYMNLPTSLRVMLWDSLLELYHETLHNSLTDILKCERDDPRLDVYSFDHFLLHFKRHAFYGVMIGIHFIPWMASSEKECAEMSKLFESNPYCPELRNLSLICGGSNVDKRITSIALHAFEKGYMDIFD